MGDFSLDVLQGAISVVRELATAGAELAPILLPMADRLMAVADAAGSETIDELVATVRAFAPSIEGLIAGGLRLLPDLLAAMRDDAANLAPAIRSVTMAAIALAPVLASGLWAATAAAGAFVLATLPISGTVLAIAVAIGAVVGILAYLIDRLGGAQAVWEGFVNFAASSVQSVVDAIYGMANQAIGVLEGLRKKANKVLPEQLQIEGKLTPIGEAPEVGDDVRSVGQSLGDAAFGSDDEGESGPGSGGRSLGGGGQGSGGQALGGSGMTVQVDNGSGSDARMERLVEDALDDARQNRSRT